MKRIILSKGNNKRITHFEFFFYLFFRGQAKVSEKTAQNETKQKKKPGPELSF